MDSFITEQNGKQKTASRKGTGTPGRGGKEDGGSSIEEKLWRVRLVEEWRDKMVSIRKEIWGRLHSGPRASLMAQPQRIYLPMLEIRV